MSTLAITNMFVGSFVFFFSDLPSKHPSVKSTGKQIASLDVGFFSPRCTANHSLMTLKIWNDMWVTDQLLNNFYFQKNKDSEMETLSTRMQLRYDKVINQPFTWETKKKVHNLPSRIIGTVSDKGKKFFNFYSLNWKVSAKVIVLEILRKPRRKRQPERRLKNGWKGLMSRTMAVDASYNCIHFFDVLCEKTTWNN